jgi:hypothetical protein
MNGIGREIVELHARGPAGYAGRDGFRLPGGGIRKRPGNPTRTGKSTRRDHGANRAGSFQESSATPIHARALLSARHSSTTPGETKPRIQIKRHSYQIAVGKTTKDEPKPSKNGSTKHLDGFIFRLSLLPGLQAARRGIVMVSENCSY